MQFSSIDLKRLNRPNLNNKTCLDSDTISSLSSLGLLRNPKKRSPNARTKISCLWFNVHGRRNVERNLVSLNDLSNHSVVFLSESWMVEEKFEPLLRNKDFFVVHAKQGHRGRPSGGLEAYTSRCLQAECISTTDHHIALRVGPTVVIGVYYRPTLELDDITADISCVINQCGPQDKMIIGGDFNISPSSPDFHELLSFLRVHSVSLRSDAATPTFVGATGSFSVIDHVFASHDIESRACRVLRLGASDHEAVQAVLKIKRGSSLQIYSDRTRQRLHVQKCSEDLAIHQSTLEDTPSEELPALLDSFFQNATVYPHKKHVPKRPWYDGFLRDLRKRANKALRCFRSTGTTSNGILMARARQVYHSNVRRAKESFETQKADELICQGNTVGVSALFREIKKYSQHTIPHFSTFYKSCTDLLVQKDTNVVLERVPSCDQKEHSLLGPITVEEVEQAIVKQRSAAHSTYPISPSNLKSLKSQLLQPLTSLYNWCFSNCTFPSQWLESSVMFVHKKGSMSDPNNFRSINVQNAMYKVYMTVLISRLSEFAEQHDLLPSLQFGFRKNRSTYGAATLLHQVIYSRLQNKQRTYVCFFDFRKCFDLIDRNLLLVKLQLLGIPFEYCSILFHIWSHMKCYVKDGDKFSRPFTPNTGTVQGDVGGALLYSLFVHDLPDHLVQDGPLIADGFLVPALLFADDLAVISCSAQGLQQQINAVQNYCQSNNLHVNTSKTKVMIFHKGRLPEEDRDFQFTYIDKPLERVSSFCYLGFDFSTQLSFSNHVSRIVSKAKKQIGMLHKQVNLRALSLEIVLKLFSIYVFPVFRYGAGLWLSSCSKASISKVDSSFSKFLKSYLGLPSHTNNAIVHFLTGTVPLSLILKSNISSFTNGLCYPSCLSGLQLSFLSNIPPPEPFSVLEMIPSSFWRSRMVDRLPNNYHYRRAICRDVTDMLHFDLCSDSSFHCKATLDCICMFCGETASAYHHYECTHYRGIM